MDREHLFTWLDQVYATRDVEIDCDQLQALLPVFVDFEIGNAAAPDDERLAQVRAHLAQCPDCAEEYAGLRTVAALETQNRLPSAEESLKKLETAATFERA